MDILFGKVWLRFRQGLVIAEIGNRCEEIRIGGGGISAEMWGI